MDTLTNLRTFLVVAQSGGFTDAAKRLNVVPSVVAKRIAQLEQAMDTRLFERSTRRVVITESGIQLRERASGLLAGFDDLARSVQRDDRKIEGQEHAAEQLAPQVEAIVDGLLHVPHPHGVVCQPRSAARAAYPPLPF